MATRIKAPEEPLFARGELGRLILPLMIEQLLMMTVGTADTVMVASAGEAVMSGVSLVDGINNLVLQVFSALSTGGAVVVSQYLGRRERDHASKAAGQLIYIMMLLALLLTGFALFFRAGILGAAFGRVEPDVMQSALVYFLITALAYPFLGIYNAGAALFRAMGNSRVSMWCALVINVVNIGVNGVLIYGFHWGAVGAGLGTLFSRMAAAGIIVALLYSNGNQLLRLKLLPLRLERGMVHSILSIGIPNGLENGVFHMGKLMVLQLVTSFGTAAVAANAAGNSIAALTSVPGNAIGLAMITVVGRCMGAREIGQAQYYTRKMMWYSFWCMSAMAALLVFGAGPLAALFGLSPMGARLAKEILQICGSGKVLFWPLAFTLPNALRAAGDTVFTMVVSQCSMFACRVALSYVLACDWGLGLGLHGVWIAMVADWVVRTAFFVPRYKRGKWQTLQVLK